jgi:hypothetical protein
MRVRKTGYYKTKNLLQNKNFKFKGTKSKSKIIKRNMEKRTKNAMMVVRENLRINLSSKWRREEFIFST